MKSLLTCKCTYVKSLWLNRQNIFLKGCNTKMLLILMKKKKCGSLSTAHLNQVFGYSETTAVYSVICLLSIDLDF